MKNWLRAANEVNGQFCDERSEISGEEEGLVGACGTLHAFSVSGRHAEGSARPLSFSAEARMVMRPGESVAHRCGSKLPRRVRDVIFLRPFLVLYGCW